MERTTKTAVKKRVKDGNTWIQYGEVGAQAGRVRGMESRAREGSD